MHKPMPGGLENAFPKKWNGNTLPATATTRAPATPGEMTFEMGKPISPISGKATSPIRILARTATWALRPSGNLGKLNSASWIWPAMSGNGAKTGLNHMPKMVPTCDKIPTNPSA